MFKADFIMNTRVQIKRLAFEEEMAKRDLSSGQVCEMLGIHTTYLPKLLKGLGYPSSKLRKKIMGLFYPVEWSHIFFIIHPIKKADNMS